MTHLCMFTVFIIVGVSVCGLLVLRHAVRTAAPAPEAVRFTAAHRWRVANYGGREPGPDSDRDDANALEILRREERRQRPEEGRN